MDRRKQAQYFKISWNVCRFSCQTLKLFSSLHNHKVCSSYSCHALQENTLKHITLEHTTCFCMYNVSMIMPKGTQMTGNHHRIMTQHNFQAQCYYISVIRKSVFSPYVFKPWYVSAILYKCSAKSTLLLVPDTR